MESRAPAPIRIDGAHGEGGGALLRTSVAMAALTQQPVRVENVRGAMRKPGLTSEDLTFLRVLEVSCRAKLQGDKPGARDLTFVPTRTPRAVAQRFELGAHEQGAVPGNALIVLESLLPVLARAYGYSRVTVTGETYNPNALTYDVFEHATLPLHRRQGVYAIPYQAYAGFGFASKGEVELEVEPSALQGLSLTERGKFVGLQVRIACAELGSSVHERGVLHSEKQIETLRLPGEVEVVEVRSRTPGAFVTVVGSFEKGIGVGTAMGAPGVRIEAVVDQAFDAFEDWFRTEATVDPYLADQLLIPAALADEPTAYTTSRVTPRLLTMAWAIKQFLPVPITILGREGEPGTVRVKH